MVKLVNRAKVTTPTIGTGNLTLGPAVDGFQSFAAAGVGSEDQIRYVIEDGDAWEIGLGVYAAAGPSLTRGPFESSAGGAAIALSGSAVVFITAIAADIATNLSYTATTSTGTLSSSTGTNATLPAATSSVAGLLTSADKTKLDGIAAGAQVNVGTDLAMGGAGNSRTIASSTGNGVIVPVASTSSAGFMSTDDKTKLDGLSGSGTTTLASLTDTNIAAPIIGDVLYFNGAAWANVDPDTAGLVAKSGNQTVGGTKTFSSAVILSAAGTATTHAVRADRSISASAGLSGGGNMTANRTIALLNIAAGSSSSGALFYNGTGRSAGRLYGGTTNPISTTRLNYDGNLHVNALTAVGDITAFSDARLKSDLAQITDALAKVSRLTGYTYTRKDTGARQTGVIAQDVREVLPEAVIETGDYLALAYGNMVGLLIEAIKELKAELEELKNGAS